MRKSISIAVSAAIGLTALTATPANARDGYLADVFTTAANFCPRNSLPADGRLMPINQNQALFALLGTMYGGDGRTTFALPNLQGSLAARTESGKLTEVRYCIMTQGIFPSRS